MTVKTTDGEQVVSDERVLELIEAGDTDFAVWDGDRLVAVILRDGGIVRVRT